MAGFKGRFRVYNDFLNPEKSDVILSVGCKGGFFERGILDDVKKIYGIDIDKNEMEKGRKNKSKIIFDYCDVTEGTEFPESFFDKAIFAEVIEHLPSGTELSALKEINRVLKKGGTLVFSTPNHHLLSRISDPLWWVRGHRHYKLETIKSLFEEAGFKIEKTLIGGGYLQSFIMLPFYMICKLGLHREGVLERVLDREYSGNGGFWTIIIKAKKC